MVILYVKRSMQTCTYVADLNVIENIHNAMTTKQLAVIREGMNVLTSKYQKEITGVSLMMTKVVATVHVKKTCVRFKLL